jgi:hypothetical protein
MTRAWVLGLALGCLLLCGTGQPTTAAETRGVTAGEFIVDPPTLINLGE